VTQARVAEREHRGPPATLAPDRLVPHGVHPAMKGVEPPAPHPALDRLRRQPRSAQLRVRDDPALRRRPARDLGVWGVSGSHIDR